MGIWLQRGCWHGSGMLMNLQALLIKWNSVFFSITFATSLNIKLYVHVLVTVLKKV